MFEGTMKTTYILVLFGGISSILAPKNVFFSPKKKRSLILTNFQNSRYTTPVVTSLGKYKEQSNELVNYLFELKQHDKMEPEAPLPSHSHVYWQWVLLAAANHTN